MTTVATSDPRLNPFGLRLGRIQERKKLADQLRQNALSPLESRISGTARNPIQVGPSPFEVVSKLLQAGLAAKTGRDSDREYEALATEMAAQRSKALEGLGPVAAKDQAAVDAGVDPSVLKYLQDSRKLDRVDTGSGIELVDQSGQSVRTLPKYVSPDASLSSETARRGQDISASTATRGQDISANTAIRGQDIGASTAAAGRATAERGQDIGAETARTNAQSQAARTDQRTAAALRKEFRSLPSVKSYESTLPIVESVKNAPDTPAGDLQVVYSVGKALDPDSVVREGELLLTQNATPILQKLAGKARAEISGQGRLTPQTRKDLVDMLEQRTQGYQQAYTRDYDTYGSYATDIGAEPDQIVGTRPETAFGVPGSKPVLQPGANPAPKLASTNGVPETPRSEAPAAALKYLQENPAQRENFRAKYGYLPPGF